MSTLFIVATPIGNLKDITFRALDTLKEVDFIICEDTRVTSRLLKHYEISKQLVSFNARTEEKKTEYVIGRIKNGETAALVSDAGTPCISDPGVRLVSKARESNINIFGIPGANAAILALSIAGLPTDSFIFEGFIPQKKGRQKKLKDLSQEKRTIVLYESVYRIKKLLQELNEYMPDRKVAIAREQTKMFEQCITGSPLTLLEKLDENPKGEFVVIISAIR